MKNQVLSLKFNFNLFASLLLLLLFGSVNVFAQILGKYEFTGVSTGDNQFNQVSSQPKYATFSPVKRQLVQWWTGDHVFNSREWGKLITEETYIEFTISAQPGYILQLQDISFENLRSNSGPASARIIHNGSGEFTNSNSLEFQTATSTIKPITWDFPDFKTPVGGSVTFRIYGWGATSYLGTFRVDNVSLSGIVIPQVTLNEFHYFNSAASKTGFVEIIVPKDFTELNALSLSLYNNAGQVYNSFKGDSFKSEVAAVYNNDRIYYLDIPSGLVDGTGGISLSMETNLLQFLSYGGVINALSGPAVGVNSKDVGLVEAAGDGDSNSIYLTEINSRENKSDAWTKSLSNFNTKGFANGETNQTLPVSFLYFKALALSKEVNLTWATATEINNDYFVVEKSLDGAKTFNPITKIKGSGNSQQMVIYHFSDRQVSKNPVYYRLKQVDLDGIFTYSAIVALKSALLKAPITLFPNPVINQVTLALGDLSGVKDLQVQVISQTGRVVYQNTNDALLKFNGFVIPVANLAPGTYHCLVIKDGVKESKPFIKL